MAKREVVVTTSLSASLRLLGKFGLRICLGLLVWRLFGGRRHLDGLRFVGTLGHGGAPSVPARFNDSHAACQALRDAALADGRGASVGVASTARSPFG